MILRKYGLGLFATVALLMPTVALAANGQANSTRVQGTPDGYGDPLQVTIVDNDGDDVSITTSSGDVASGATDSGNPVKIGGVFNTTLPTFTNGQRGNIQITNRGEVLARIGNAGTYASAFGAFGGGGDALSNTVDSLVVNNFNEVFNGSTWDRQRSVVNGTNSTGTGIVAAGQIGQRDDTSPQTCTENQFCSVRITAGGMQLNSPASVVPYSAVLGTPAVQIRGASGNVANAAASAVLTGTATTTVYISGFTCTPGGATAAALVNITVTNTLGGTLTYTAGAPAGAAVMGTPINVQFNPPHPASAVNTAITVSMPALGAGNTNAACVATGFYM